MLTYFSKLMCSYTVSLLILETGQASSYDSVKTRLTRDYQTELLAGNYPSVREWPAGSNALDWI